MAGKLQLPKKITELKNSIKYLFNDKNKSILEGEMGFSQSTHDNKEAHSSSIETLKDSYQKWHTQVYKNFESLLNEDIEKEIENYDKNNIFKSPSKLDISFMNHDEQPPHASEIKATGKNVNFFMEGS